MRWDDHSTPTIVASFATIEASRGIIVGGVTTTAPCDEAASFHTLAMPPHFFIFFSNYSLISSRDKAQLDSARLSKDITRSAWIVQL